MMEGYSKHSFLTQSTKGFTLSDGVTGNTSVFGAEESRFDP